MAVCNHQNAAGPNLRCPPGLQQLMSPQELILKPGSDRFEYSIKLNEDGEKIYFIVVGAERCREFFLGPSLTFTARVQDPSGRGVIFINSKDKRQADVFASSNFIGRIVKEQGSFKTHHFSILNSSGQIVLKIKKPSCVSNRDIESRTRNKSNPAKFKLYSSDLNRELGKIHRKFKGFILTNPFYKLVFPPYLDVETKGILIGATIYIVKINKK